LYNWQAAMYGPTGSNPNPGEIQGACPLGWHLPGDTEWTVLSDYLIHNGYGFGESGNEIAKSLAATFNWANCVNARTPGNEVSENNSSGFSGLPSGMRYLYGSFFSMGFDGFWWSSTEAPANNAWLRCLDFNNTHVVRTSYLKDFGLSVRCVRNKTSVPWVTTVSPDSVNLYSALLKGEVVFDGWAEVTERGFCYGTSLMPTTEDQKVILGNGTGSFRCIVPELSASTIYYARAYAINSEGTAYGEQVTFTTLANPSGTFIDHRDGKVYKWVKIGNQVWMAENLAFLPWVSHQYLVSVTSPTYHVYGYIGTDVHDAKLMSGYLTYGVLYNWMAAMESCPYGWHLPDEAEWITLTEYLINNNYGYEGSRWDIAKSMASKTNWMYDSTTGTPGNVSGSNNISGFSGLPGGGRYTTDGFLHMGSNAYWWYHTMDSQETAPCHVLSYNYVYPDVKTQNMANGFSVRCVKN
jgi:uncharacterized protein (TIGR02145 family)